MKLSIWSQFSSNNSVNYAVVGTFSSEEDVKQAHQILLRMFSEMTELTRRVHDNEITFDRFDTLVEQNFTRRYEPNSQTPLNWRILCRWMPVSFHTRPSDHIAILGPHIVFDSDGTTTSPIGEELRDVLTLFGAKTHAQITRKAPDVSFRVVCHAPDPQVALRLYETLLKHRYIPSKPYERFPHDVFVPTPWAIYHPQLQGMTPAQYAAIHQAWELWMSTIEGWFDLHRAVYRDHLTHISLQAPLLAGIMRVWQQTMLEDILISHHDQMIFLEESRLTRNLILALPAIHIWMEHAGCVVTYEFLSEEASE